MKVGYIGLGIMGSAMASNLLKAGFPLAIWNRTAAKAEALKAEGATWADSPAQLARDCDVVCINVTDTPDVEAILFGDGRENWGIEAGAHSGLIVIDHSTISPEATRKFAERLKSKGVQLLDAPVTGGDVGAKAGTLTIMVGGFEMAFENVLPILKSVGKNVTYMGPSGSGQVTKACNQIALFCALAGVCEAIEFARSNGIDPSDMIEVVSTGAGGSWQLANIGPRIVEGNFAPGFMIDLAVKDLNMVVASADTHDIELEVVEKALEYLKRVQADGGGKFGTPAMAKAIVRGCGEG